MRVLVVYASAFGSTKGIAERITETLRRSVVDVVMASAEEAPDPADFEAVVVGSAVHGGHWLEPAAAFLERHAASLAGRPVWLFSSGPVGDRAVAAPQPDPHEVARLRPRIGPREHRVFAGSFDRATADFSDLGLVERTIVRRFLPNGDWRDWDAIEAWAVGITRALGASEAPRRPREPVPA